MYFRSLILIFIFPQFLNAQLNKTFKITGRSDFYNNRQLTIMVGLYPLKYNDCMLSETSSDSVYNPNVTVRNGEFELHGSLRYPHPLTVSYYDVLKNQGHTSAFYFIDSGEVCIVVSNLAEHKRLATNLKSKSNEEYKELRRYYSSVVDTFSGKIRNMQVKQKLMRTYVASHPNSYVALWDLLLDYSYVENDGIKRVILETIQLFSSKIRATKTYQALRNDLEKDLKLTAGKVFPDIKLKPDLSVNLEAQKNRFTLVEFWYSHCVPCLKQFPDLRQLYLKYKNKKFSIIGISVDKEENKGDWLNAIRKYDLEWPQYLDVNGKESRLIHVNSYPSNFLLDNRGVIIKKDISPEQLKEYLRRHLGAN